MLNFYFKICIPMNVLSVLNLDHKDWKMHFSSLELKNIIVCMKNQGQIHEMHLEITWCSNNR